MTLGVQARETGRVAGRDRRHVLEVREKTAEVPPKRARQPGDPQVDEDGDAHVVRVRDHRIRRAVRSYDTARGMLDDDELPRSKSGEL